MTEKYQSIVSKKLFLGFCITELFILVVLKVIQTIYPYSFIKVPPMFSAILLNALFMLLPPQGFIYECIRFMVWVFYIPSQAVLTSSYLTNRTEA